jgi:hypothetical protein
MFQAMSVMNPHYQFNDVDIIADRNNLRVLLEFVSGKANGPFRLDLFSELNTLVIARKEDRYWKFSDGKSYGYNFERFFTCPAEGLEEATSHYRAIRYPLGPLSVVVRFEADAFDDGVADEPRAREHVTVAGGTMQRPYFRHDAPIRVQRQGHTVPARQMVELKTQVFRKDSPVSCQDQLWFGRTSLLYTGRYSGDTGMVKKIVLEDAMSRIKIWELRMQENLRKLAGLLGLLRAIMKKENRKNRAVVLVREDKAGPLTVRSLETLGRPVAWKAFERHWRRSVVEVPRGGWKAQQTAPRGQGDFRGGRGQQAAPRGQGRFSLGRGQQSATQIQGEFRDGVWRPPAPRGGRGQQNAPRGRGELQGAGRVGQGPE